VSGLFTALGQQPPIFVLDGARPAVKCVLLGVLRHGCVTAARIMTIATRRSKERGICGWVEF